MAKDREYWARKEHFERTGEWPETPKQRAAREAKERSEREESSTETAHPVVSSAQLDQVSKVVEAWHKANPGFR
jgi:lysylphosphatidylglycerol synthetase-like protein (DUF2156 family)